MGVYRQDEIAASVAAHRDLGPGYDDAVAAGLVERIGEEIDKRIDARLGGRGAQVPVPPPPAPGRRYVGSTFLALGSMGLGLGATAIALNSQNGSVDISAGQIILAMFIWAAITVINVAYARHR
jgi:hypothetical protein